LMKVRPLISERGVTGAAVVPAAVRSAVVVISCSHHEQVRG
jgi:hypothetical protein